jgi:hypothetical protein
MNRVGNTTEMVLLSSDNLKKLSNSPLLSGQPIFESLFHEGVVVCEGDADRCLYQTVAVKNLNNDSAFFVHSHGKQNIKDVVRLMHNSGVPVVAIVDIDILNSKEELQSLLSALSPKGDFEQILETRSSISQEIEGKDDSAVLADILIELNDLTSELHDNKISVAKTRNKLENIRKGVSKWDEVKSKGLSALCAKQNESVTRLVDSCKENGLFIVYRGELESWMDLGIGKRHKAKWVVKAMELLNEKCPDDLSDFVKEVLAHLRNRGISIVEQGSSR